MIWAIAAVSFAAAAGVTGISVPFIRRFALRQGLIDQANSSRKVHGTATPRLGGVALVAGFFAPFLGLVLCSASGVGAVLYGQPTRAFAFIAGGLAIAAVGLFDDLFGAGAKGKFIAQFGVAAYVWCAGFRIEQISLPGGFVISLGAFGVVLTVGWIVGVMNALNLADGLDGLAAGIALIAALTNLYVAWIGDHALMILCMASLSGGLLAFLRYNFHPASIFMGDTGSLFLGYVLAVSSLQTRQKSSTAISLFVPMIALALPIFDTLLAMGRRALRGRSMFSGDKEHIHHLLLETGLSHRKAVLILYAVSAMLGVGAVALISLGPGGAVALLLVLSIAAVFALWFLGAFRVVGVEVLAQRRRTLALRSAMRGIKARLQRATSVEELVSSIVKVGPALSAAQVRVELIAKHSALGDELVTTSWKAEQPNQVALNQGVRACFPIEPGLGHLEVQWYDRNHIDRDHEIAIENLCTLLPFALERTSSGISDTRLPAAWSQARLRRDGNIQDDAQSVPMQATGSDQGSPFAEPRMPARRRNGPVNS